MVRATEKGTKRSKALVARTKEGIDIKVIGEVTDRVTSLLDTVPADDRKIYFAQSNLEHMKRSHPSDFEKYGRELVNILSSPDYVGQNPSDGSIEYVKEFLVDGEYVKVAVRLSHSNRYFARSLYVLNNNRVKNFIAKGTLKRLQNGKNSV